jgi:hypothetical protein
MPLNFGDLRIEKVRADQIEHVNKQTSPVNDLLTVNAISNEKGSIFCILH